MFPLSHLMDLFLHYTKKIWNPSRKSEEKIYIPFKNDWANFTITEFGLVYVEES